MGEINFKVGDGILWTPRCVCVKCSLKDDGSNFYYECPVMTAIAKNSNTLIMGDENISGEDFHKLRIMILENDNLIQRVKLRNQVRKIMGECRYNLER